jgi:hypothetical protein
LRYADRQCLGKSSQLPPQGTGYKAHLESLTWVLDEFSFRSGDAEQSLAEQQFPEGPKTQ